MPLQSYNIAVGNLTDDSEGNNYSVNAPVYITTENLVSVQIYKDLAGTIPIPQNGVDNTTDENGTFTFYVESGQYLANVGGTNYIINVIGSDYFDSRINETIAEINEQNKLVLDNYGKNFNLTDAGFDFSTGGTIITSNQLVSDSSGNYWQYQNAIPTSGFVVAPGTVPSSPTWEIRVFSDHSTLSNRNAIGAHDDIYTRLFDNVADMKSETGLYVGMIVSTKGYYSPLDRGDGMYEIVSSGTGVDDGGEYHDLDNGFQAKLFIDDRVNAAQYGIMPSSSAIYDDRFTALINKFRQTGRTGIHFPSGTYTCGVRWNLSNLQAKAAFISSDSAYIYFVNLGGANALVECINSTEIHWDNIRLYYTATETTDPNNCPQTGLLLARNAANAYTGRCTFTEFQIKGGFSVAPYYNSGAEENNYTNTNYENILRDKTAMVITCSNHLGIPAHFASDITSSPVSTTLNVFVKPKWIVFGDNNDQAVLLRGCGAVHCVSPYVAGGGDCHYRVQAIDQAVGSLILDGLMSETGRGEIQNNATFTCIVEGDGSKDATSIKAFTHLSYTAQSIYCRNLKTMKDWEISMPRKFSTSTIGGEEIFEIENCEIKCEEDGIDLRGTDNLRGGYLYTDESSNILLPDGARSTVITAGDLHAPVVAASFKSRLVASTFVLDAYIMGVAGGGTINNFSTTASNINGNVTQEFYLEKTSSSCTITNNGGGTGNIRTSTGSDITLSGTEVAKVIYYGRTDTYHVEVVFPSA